jgi:predicted metal-binding membrane protein
VGGLTPPLRPARAVPLLPARAGLVVVLCGLAAVAWWDTARRMAGMDTSPGADLGGLAFFTGAWVVMMAAMMLPSVAPAVAVFDRIRATAAAGAEGTALFVAGYLALWTAVGLLAYAVVEAGRALDLGVLAFDEAGRELTAAVLLGAAAYELTPLKRRCLVHCRGPLMFLLERWRDGRRGALRLGALHGAWCVGCCWALMAVLFALGVMSVGWMVLVAALIAGEKLLPAWAHWAVVVVLAALGVAVLAEPGLVPGLDGSGPAAPMAM